MRSIPWRRVFVTRVRRLGIQPIPARCGLDGVVPGDLRRMGDESALSETWHCSRSRNYSPGSTLASFAILASVAHGNCRKGKGGQAWPQTATSLARVGEAETSVKLRFSRYLPVAWLLIPELHHHREVFPPTTAASACARFRQIEPGGAALGSADGGGGAVLPTWAPGRSASSSSPWETAGGPTRAMKPSAPRSARMVPGQLEAQSAAPALGAGSRMTARRPPAPSLPLTCASGTSLSLAPSSPREPGHHHRSGMIPRRSSAASGPSCDRVVGWTALCCVRRAANAADVSSLAEALAAGALVLFVCGVIPLLREKRARLAPRQSLNIAVWFWTNLRAWLAARRRSVLLLATSGAASDGNRWTATPVPPVAAVTGRDLLGAWQLKSRLGRRGRWCSGLAGWIRPR